MVRRGRKLEVLESPRPKSIKLKTEQKRLLFFLWVVSTQRLGSLFNMESASVFSKYAGFIGVAILSRTGKVVSQEGDEFEVAQVYSLLQDTGALVNSGALGECALKKITGEHSISTVSSPGIWFFTTPLSYGPSSCSVCVPKSRRS